MGNKISTEMLSKELDIDEEVLQVMAYELDDEIDDFHAIDDEEERERSYFIDEEECRTTLLRVRIDWFNHVRKCQLEKLFNRKHRMTYDSFCRLVSILLPHIEKNANRANRGMYIAPEVVVAVGIRYLAGEPYTALNDICNIATSSVYKLRNRFIDAMLASEELKIKFPQSGEEWEKVRQGFENISSYKLFGGCVGAVDGFFQPIIQPQVDDANGNPLAYMSGHYGMFGLNCQAVCDARECFLFFGVVAPGKTNDSVAFEYCTALKEALNNLPYGLYMVGDAAYTPWERMLIPLVGSQRLGPVNDTYNFYLSQVRIRIEMSFVRLVNKWRILRSPMLGSLKTSSRMLLVCAMLHNFVIDSDGHNAHLQFPRDGNNSDNDFIVSNAPTGLSYLPTIPDLVEERSNVCIDIVSSSTVQASLLQVIESSGIRRPRHNIERNGVGRCNRQPDIKVNYYAPE